MSTVYKSVNIAGKSLIFGTGLIDYVPGWRLAKEIEKQTGIPARLIPYAFVNKLMEKDTNSLEIAVSRRYPDQERLCFDGRHSVDFFTAYFGVITAGELIIYSEPGGGFKKGKDIMSPPLGDIVPASSIPVEAFDRPDVALHMYPENIDEKDETSVFEANPKSITIIPDFVSYNRDATLAMADQTTWIPVAVPTKNWNELPGDAKEWLTKKRVSENGWNALSPKGREMTLWCAIPANMRRACHRSPKGGIYTLNEMWERHPGAEQKGEYLFSSGLDAHSFRDMLRRVDLQTDHENVVKRIDGMKDNDSFSSYIAGKKYIVERKGSKLNIYREKTIYGRGVYAGWGLTGSCQVIVNTEPAAVARLNLSPLADEAGKLIAKIEEAFGKQEILQDLIKAAMGAF